LCGGDISSPDSGTAERLVAELFDDGIEARREEHHASLVHGPLVESWDRAGAIAAARSLLAGLPSTVSRPALRRIAAMVSGRVKALGLDTREALDLTTALDRRVLTREADELRRLVGIGHGLALDVFRALGNEDLTLQTVARVLADRETARREPFALGV